MSVAEIGVFVGARVGVEVGVAVDVIVGLSVGLGVGVFVGRGVGDGVAVGCSVGDAVGVDVAVGCIITVGVSEGAGEGMRVSEGVYVGNKPIARIDVSTIVAAKHPQQQRAIARGITGKASLLPAIVGFTRIESSFRNIGRDLTVWERSLAKPSSFSSKGEEKA